MYAAKGVETSQTSFENKFVWAWQQYFKPMMSVLEINGKLLPSIYIWHYNIYKSHSKDIVEKLRSYKFSPLAVGLVLIPILT